MTRGVLYIVWGTGYADLLRRSVESLQRWHPELEHHVAELPADSTLLCKSRMFELSPFDSTLYLDADAMVLANLDYGFAMAERFGIALTHSANPWQRRYDRLEHEHADAVEYSSGVVFFNRNWGTSEFTPTTSVFGEWNKLGRFDSSTPYRADDGIRRAPYNDQALLTLAIHRTQFCPFVLPQNWSLFPRTQKTFWGELKIWHDREPVPQSLLAWNKEQSKPGAVIRCASLP